MESEVNEKISKILETLGLSKNEILIYLDLTLNANSSALDVSKRTGIHRSNTYDSLRKLIERGFAKEIIDENKKLFVAISPEKIGDYMKQKEQEFRMILPEMKNLSDNGNKHGEVLISQGIFALRDSVLDLLKIGEPILVYGISRLAVENFGEGFLKEFHKERIKKKIVMKHIYNKGAIDRIKLLSKMPYTEAKCLPEKYDSTVSTNICGDVVKLFVFGKPTLIISIDNKEVANSYRNYFELMWKQAKTI